MVFQISSAPRPADPQPIAPTIELPLVEVGGPPGTVSFEKEALKGKGGYIRDNGSGLGFHITGTDENGKYIKAHTVDKNGQPANPVPTNCPKVLIMDERKLIEMFDLVQMEGKPTQYTRRGFQGYYVICKETDGTVSLFYSGGSHDEGEFFEAQTFHHGSWDVYRRNDPRPHAKPSTEPPTQPQKQVDPPPIVKQANPDPPTPKEDEPKIDPATSLKWLTAAKQAVESILTKDNGVTGTSGRESGFAAVFYASGAFTNFNRHYPADGAKFSASFIPYNKLSADLQTLKTYTFQIPADKPEQRKNEFLARTADRRPVVVTLPSGPFYVFPTESSMDGYGVVLLDGRGSALPAHVKKVYEESARRSDGMMIYGDYVLIDEKAKLYGLLRSNGQVVLVTAGKKNAELFDPLLGILRTAYLTDEQERAKSKDLATLNSALNAKGGYAYRKVSWDPKLGQWAYTQDGVPTRIPPRIELTPPE